MDKELYHFGVKGQKWGVRRFQNDDGSLTSEGKERYSNNSKAAQRDLNRLDKRQTKAKATVIENYSKADIYKRRGKTAKEQKFAKRGDAALAQVMKYEKTKKEVQDLLSKHGHKVTSKSAMRLTPTVKSVFGAATMATLVGLIDPSSYAAMSFYRPLITRGTKYKVE